jgi:WD40 repeat protein
MNMGIVATFYSYKGGVGRSFVLANVATALARWGFRVLCVDWDLEAPGLYYYFQDACPAPDRGLVELIDIFVEHGQGDWEDVVVPVSLSGMEGELDLIAAGSFSKNYAPLFQKINWVQLYDEHNLGDYLESLRTEWKLKYDFIFIDSRTGLTDSGGICTVQLPDILVFLCVPNMQSLLGVVGVVRGLMESRKSINYDRGRLLTVPIVSRFDSRQEYELSQHWMEIFTRELAPFYEGWGIIKGSNLPPEAQVRRLLERTTIPYFSVWSFGEKLPIQLEAASNSTDLVSFYLKTLASLIAHRLDNVSLLLESADAYVGVATREGARASQNVGYDIYLSYSASDAGTGDALAKELQTQSIAVFLSNTDATGPYDPIAADRILSVSKNFVFVVGQSRTENQEREGKMFLRQTLDDQVERKILVVISPGADVQHIPPFLQSVQSIDSAERSPRFVATQIAALLGLNRKMVLEHTLKGHKDVILRVTWSPNGSLVASASVDKTARIWSAETGKIVTVLRGHAFGVNRVAWSKDGRFVATCSFDRTIRIWSTGTWTHVHTISAHHSDIPTISWSPDGRLLASGSVGHSIGIWDTQSWQRFATLRGHTGEVNRVLWFENGKRLCSCSSDKTIRIWDIFTPEATPMVLEGHTLALTDVACSPDGLIIASASFDRTIRIWDAESGESIHILRGHGDEIRSVTFARDGRFLASNSADGWVCVWDCATWDAFTFIEEKVSGYWPGSIAFSPSAPVLATFGERDRVVRLWSLSS